MTAQRARQRILVLEAENFIGQHLLRRLRESNCATPVVAVSQRVKAPLEGVDYRLIDARQIGSFARALADIDAVVDCIEAGAEAVRQDARNLFTAASQLDHKPLIIYLSSMTVYGDAIGLVNEGSPLNGSLGPYAMARIEAERLASQYPRTVVFRAGCIYGPGSIRWSSWFARWLLSHRLGDLGNQGDGYCNLVHVDDVAEAILRCLQRPLPPQLNVFNLSTPDPPTWNDYLIRYGCALNAIPIRRVSRRKLRVEATILAPILKITELALRASHSLAERLPPPMPSSLFRLMQQEIRLDVRRAEQELGLNWTPLDTGIAETARWYLESQRS